MIVLYTDTPAPSLQSEFSGLDGGVGILGRARSRYTPGMVSWYRDRRLSTNWVQEGRALGFSCQQFRMIWYSSWGHCRGMDIL